jgi:hypothetical protein
MARRSPGRLLPASGWVAPPKAGKPTAKAGDFTSTPSLQHSITPFFPYSNIPPFQHSFFY